MITVYSVLTGFIWFNIGILIIYILRKNSSFVSFNYSYVMIALIFSCVLRIIFPFEFPFTKEIQSKTLLPHIIAALKTPLESNRPILDRLSLSKILWSVSLLGTVFLLVRQSIAYKAFYSHYSTSANKSGLVPEELYLSECRRLGIINKPRLIKSGKTSIPFTTGFLRPIIVIPDTDFSSEELTHILRHELFHYRNHDIWLKLSVNILLAIFWWNPLIYLLKKDVQQILEIRCDLLTCKKMSVSERAEYLKTILNVMKKCPKNKHIYYATGLINENSKSACMMQRFDVSLNYTDKKLKAKPLIQIICVACLFFIVSYAFVLQPYYLPPGFYDDPNMITSKNSYIIKEGDAYKLYKESIFICIIEEEEFRSLKLIGIPIEKEN